MEVLTQPTPAIAPAQSAPSLSPRAGKRVDFLLKLFTVAFAFLAASFTATNSDLWLHLATGRLISTGGYAFGVDPFSYTTEGVYWANHAWLFDLILYGIYQAVGGTAVVFLKALGVTALAGVMLGLPLRTGGPVWLGVGCTLLAILAMSPRLLVQPQCLSLIMLGLCFSLVHVGGRAYKAIPILIALWVNLDGWFLLGPLVVALFVLGERLMGRHGGRPLQAVGAALRGGTHTFPTWLLPACLAACLLSPHNFRALVLPPELSPAVWSSEFRDDPRFAGFFAHPWRLAPFGRTGGYSLAAWANLVLFAGGLASFAWNRRAIVSGRGFVWLLFAALAAWQTRLIPFFAVVAGPILALNLQERMNAGSFLRAGRIAALFGSLALIVLAWPGWLQSVYARDRALAWNVVPDPSLVRAANGLREWREGGALPAGSRVFTTHPDGAHHLAWFAPGERSFLDSRLQLFTSVASENRAVGGLLGFLPDRDASVRGERILRDRQVAVVVLQDPDRQALGAALRTVAESPDRWSLLRVDGTAVAVSFNPAGSLAVPQFDAERAAFGSSRGPGLPEVPFAGGPSVPEPDPWWNLAAHRQGGRSWEADASPVFLRFFELQQGGSERSPALPLLAIRTARLGIAAHPRADDAWLALARAYLLRGRGSWEATAGSNLSLLRYLQHVQVVAALSQTVVRNPDSAAAHELLAGAFGERQLFDLQLYHRREQQRLANRAGPVPGETADARAERLARLAEVVAQLERTVQDGENRFLVHTHSLAGNPLERARIARELGLGNKALDALRKSHPDLYGVDGLRFLIDLLLQTGQIYDASILLERDELSRHPDALMTLNLPGSATDGRTWGYSLPAYHWFEFCRCAASGQYERAEAALDRIRDRLLQEERSETAPLTSALAFQLACESGLSGNAIARMHAQLRREILVERLKQARFMSVERADIHVLGGLLHLERGAAAAADAEFERALAIYGPLEKISPVLPGQPLAIRHREAIRRYAK